jgi:regulator of sigma E protease
VKSVISSLSKWIRGKEKGQVGGPIRVVKDMQEAAQAGWAVFINFVGAISAYLAFFNLLPLPALDGGRLMFLGFEAVTRKRPNPTMEAQIHAVGLVMFLLLMVYVTFANDLGLKPQ